VWVGFMHRQIAFSCPGGVRNPESIMKFGSQGVKPFSVTNA